MRYLRDSDYRYKITANDFQTLVEEDENPDSFILDAELKSQDKISLFLRDKYDLSLVFETYPNYITGTTYTTGNTFVWYNDFLYQPIVNTSSLPITDNWQLVEPRFPLIVEWMIVISLWNLHHRISPENVPTHRQLAYEEVMKLLKMIMEGKLIPDFPKIESQKLGIVIGGDQALSTFHY